MSSLLTIWQDNREFVEEKSIQQVLAMCGDGALKDASRASQEFREFLDHVPSGLLGNYAQTCLERAFDDSGLVLQDVVNQVGSRLGFLVEHGRYRGIGGSIGFDGIWASRDEHNMLIEVKTTDAYRISLETVAGYRRKLIETGRLREALSSILLVVGRQDTGDLEAQIRGSRYAWDTRLISVDALCQLIKVKENLDEPKTALKIVELLKPREYTRLDPIIDLIFDTSVDSGAEPELSLHGGDAPTDPIAGDTPADTARLRTSVLEIVSRYLGVTLIRQSRSVSGTSDQKTAVLCLASKRYVRGGGNWYWFTIRQSSLDYLHESKSAFICLACGSAEQILLFPKDAFMPFLSDMRSKEGNNWQVEIDWNSRVFLNQPRIDVTQHVLTTSKAKG